MPPRPNFARVPTIAQVVPGAHVNIVLKQDQPTGRTVDGLVQNVLTRGNHPRGIKVRLSDGRVGRVQTMFTGGGSGTSSFSTLSAAQQHSMPPAVGIDDDVPQEQLGLDAYIKPAKSKQSKKRGVVAAALESSRTRSTTPPPVTAPPTTATTTCPVCGDFEGDEAAVSHHVSTHFD